MVLLEVSSNVLDGMTSFLPHQTVHFFGIYGGHEVSQVANYGRDRVHMVLAEEIELVKVKPFGYEAARKEETLRHQWCFDPSKQSYSMESVKLNRSLISWATHHFKLLKYLVGLRHRWRWKKKNVGRFRLWTAFGP
jgi:hypothetical protein